MKVVLDTNILISALGWVGNPNTIVRLAVDKKIKLAISMDIIEEFKETAREPEFKFSEEDISDFIEAMMGVAELVMPTEKLEIIKNDLSDNRILECASEAKTDYIVTGDQHLLELREFRGIKILKAKQFLDIL